MYNNSELQNKFVGRHRKPAKYACEMGGQRGVRIKGNWTIGWYLIGVVDYGEGNLATGRR